MYKISLFLMSLCIFSFFNVSQTFAATVNIAELSLDRQTNYTKLQNSVSGLSVSWSKLNRTPRFIGMNDPGSSISPKGDFKERTLQFINSYKPLFKFSENQNNSFVPTTSKTDRYGMNHVVVQQRFKDIPVYGASLTAHYRQDGSLSSINSSLLPDISDLSIQPSITVIQAVGAAKGYLEEHQIPVEDTIDILKLKEQLYIYNQGLFSQQQDSTHLVWSFALSGKLFFIDAHDGVVVHVLENVLTAKVRETYVMADCYDTAGTLTYDENGLIDGQSEDEQAALAHDYAGLVYDYYNGTFDRDSFDDTDPDDASDGGGVLVSQAHYDELVFNEDTGIYECSGAYENAKWDPEDNTMKYGENFLVLDIAAHEVTHAVVQYSVGTNNDDTLTYENESGALNESYADIFGEFIELENGGEGEWLLGEDLTGGPSRDFAEPNMGVYVFKQSYFPYDVIAVIDYIIINDGSFQLIQSVDQFRETFQPIQSVDEAKAYFDVLDEGILVLDKEQLGNIQSPKFWGGETDGDRFLVPVDSINFSKVTETADGYIITAYSDIPKNCVDEVYLYTFLLTTDGHLFQEDKQLIWEMINKPSCIFD